MKKTSRMCLLGTLKGSESEGAMDRKKEILQTFSDINYAYNNCTKYDTLKRMLDELTEPCDDAISRILEIMWNCRGKHTESIDKVKMEQIIRENLSFVTPKQKMGRWIRITNGAMKEKYICSECSRQIEDDGIEGLLPIIYPYCHCGAKMESEGTDEKT